MTSLLTHPELSVKPVVLVAPQSVAAAASATNAAGIDTLGFDGFLIIPQMGVGDSVCATTLTESATLGGSYTAVLDEASTPVAVSIPFLATDDGTLKVGFFRTDRRLRFIKAIMAMTGGAASLVSCIIVMLSARDSVYQDVTYTYKI